MLDGIRNFEYLPVFPADRTTPFRSQSLSVFKLIGGLVSRYPQGVSYGNKFLERRSAC